MRLEAFTQGLEGVNLQDLLDGKNPWFNNLSQQEKLDALVEVWHKQFESNLNRQNESNWNSTRAEDFPVPKI